MRWEETGGAGPVVGVNDEGCGLPQVERRGDWMQTYTGRQYWPLDPRPADVCAEDIAHHLSLICRYCGACREFYSVAEHSLGVLHVVREHLRFVSWYEMDVLPWCVADFERTALRYAWGHDAPEGYCHDLIRPIKRCISGYDEIEALNARAIGAALRICMDPPREVLDLVKAADNAMLLAEQAQLMAPAPAKWAPISVPSTMLDDAHRFLRRRKGPWWWPWSRRMTPRQAERAFAKAYWELPR